MSSLWDEVLRDQRNRERERMLSAAERAIAKRKKVDSKRRKGLKK